MQAITRSSIVLSAALSGCRDAAPDLERVRDIALLADGPFDESPLRVRGGTLYQGSDAALLVGGAPPFSMVELYLGRKGEGPPDCDTFAPTCLDLVEPELYATSYARGDGAARFRVLSIDFPITQEIAWQPVAIPELGQVVVGWPAIRHVAVGASDAAVDLVRATEEAGIDVFTRGNTHTGGSSWFDYNGDLWPDLFVVNGFGRQNVLYRNNGDGTFTEMPGLLQKPDVLLEPSGTKVADVDGDRDLDVFVSVDNPRQMVSYQPQPHEGGPNLLFVNEGNGSFVEQAEAAGLVDPRGWRTSDAAFADYDRDGCIDLAAGNWAMAAIPANDNFSRLLRGNCDGTFTDVTAEMGTDGDGRDTLVTFWWDANNDRFPDLYLGNATHQLSLPDFDPTANHYYNLGGAGFEDQVPARQPWLALDAYAPMGADAADIDLDGDWDLYVADNFFLGPVPRGNPLYLGSPHGRLSENHCSVAGVCAGSPVWPANFADFDRDRWPDLWLGTATGADDFLVYINKRDGTFEHHQQHDFGPLPAQGGSVADYDGDGDVDVFVWVQAGESQLYRNEPAQDLHWLEVKLYGSASSWDAIGAEVVASVDGDRLVRRVSGGDSAHSQSDSILHFGLGEADTVDRLEVHWPSGTVQTFDHLAADDLLRIDETDGLLVEEIAPLLVHYDRVARTLTVEVASTWGGRSDLLAVGFGRLRYEVELGSFVGEFADVPFDPRTVRVESRRGASVDAAVTAP